MTLKQQVQLLKLLAECYKLEIQLLKERAALL